MDRKIFRISCGAESVDLPVDLGAWIRTTITQPREWSDGATKFRWVFRGKAALTEADCVSLFKWLVTRTRVLVQMDTNSMPDCRVMTLDQDRANGVFCIEVFVPPLDDVAGTETKA